MNNAQLLQTLFEVVTVILIILGLKFEPALSKWEEKTFYKIMDRIKGGKK